MLIALDYDNTYTHDPLLWLAFIHTLRHRNHDVVVVTMRFESEGHDMDPRLTEQCNVIFTGRRAKHPFCAQLGVRPHVWIDDSPHFVHMDAL